MFPKRGQEPIYPNELSDLHVAHKKIEIHGERVRWIDVAAPIEEASSPEAGLLRDIVPTFVQVAEVGRQKPIPDDTVVFVDGQAMAINCIDLRMLGKKLVDKAQGTRR